MRLAPINFEMWVRMYLDGRAHADVADALTAAVV